MKLICGIDFVDGLCKMGFLKYCEYLYLYIQCRKQLEALNDYTKVFISFFFHQSQRVSENEINRNNHTFLSHFLHGGIL